MEEAGAGERGRECENEIYIERERYREIYIQTSFFYVFILYLLLFLLPS